MLGILRIYTCYPPDTQGIYHLLGHIFNPLTRVLFCLNDRLGKFKMHKILIKRIQKRLGFWIRYERKRLLEISNDPKLRQEKFILLGENENFYDFVPGDNVCSRSTLSRIENGKFILKKSPISFFLKRLGKKYRINDIDQKLIDSTIYAFYVFFFSNNKISTQYLEKILDDTNSKITDNFLWDEDYKVLCKLLNCFKHYELLSLDEYKEFLSKFSFYHENLKNLLIYYFCFSVYFNPELWHKNQELIQIINKEYLGDDLLSLFNTLFNSSGAQVIRLFYKYSHKINRNSFLHNEYVLIKKMFDEPINLKHCPELAYVNLIYKLKNKNYYVEHHYESNIFSHLHHHRFNDDHDIGHLLHLIKDEPNPRLINQIVLQTIYPKIKTKYHMSKLLSFLIE